MLLNPYTTVFRYDHDEERAVTLEGELAGVEGFSLPDTHNPERLWTVERVYMPLSGTAVGGLRFMLIDQYLFRTFCNQRDFEVLIGESPPGVLCPWLGEDYPTPGDREWLGFSCDDEDLRDDLFWRELYLREHGPEKLVPGLLMSRRIHLRPGWDMEEDFFFLGFQDPETGRYPDTTFATVERRWVRSERRRIRWQP